ncbi:MAG: DUF3696 domain-containing protein [Lachnospiraceae bacterium]|nr:DUF3696 domain-containing protein [Lachnospiraceae bacterium]MCI9151521.1 DUF3696 domain-containing protein [Lachnospiraceae bacterium]
MKRYKKIERVSGIVEIILLGFALPTIYVSERQDGSLLVLEAAYEYGGKECLYRKIFSDESEKREGTEFYKEINVRYLTADRIGVEDTYQKSLEGKDKIGIRCEYAFFYLAGHRDEEIREKGFIFDSSTKMTLGGQVDYWLERILGYRVIVEEIPGTELIRVAYRNRELGRDIRPKNVGTGVSYIAEIIIAAFSCRKDDVLIIENPEIHLHPSGQCELMEFLIFLARRGLQVVMETHSDHVFNGLRRCVSSDRISNAQVRIYFFRQNEDKISMPVEIVVDENGHVKNQQEGLFDQIEKDLDVILGW